MKLAQSQLCHNKYFLSNWYDVRGLFGHTLSLVGLFTKDRNSQKKSYDTITKSYRRKLWINSISRQPNNLASFASNFFFVRWTGQNCELGKCGIFGHTLSLVGLFTKDRNSQRKSYDTITKSYRRKLWINSISRQPYCLVAVIGLLFDLLAE